MNVPLPFDNFVRGFQPSREIVTRLGTVLLYQTLIVARGCGANYLGALQAASPPLHDHSDGAFALRERLSDAQRQETLTRREGSDWVMWA